MSSETLHILKDFGLIIATFAAIYGLYEKHLKNRLQKQLEQERKFFEQREAETNKKMQDFFYKYMEGLDKFIHIMTQTEEHYYSSFKDLQGKVSDDLKEYKNTIAELKIAFERFKLEIVEVINRPRPGSGDKVY